MLAYVDDVLLAVPAAGLRRADHAVGPHSVPGRPGYHMVERAVWQLPGFPVAGAGAVNRSGDDVQDLAVGLECRRCSLENSRGTVERTAGEKYCDTRHGKSE